MMCFIYRSLPTVPVADAILDIVRVSEQRNAASGVSGVLVYGESRYLQMVEGPRDAVAEAMARIRRDLRHRLLWDAERPVTCRSVSPELPMGYLGDVEVARAARAEDRHTLAQAGPKDAGRVIGALLEIARVKYPSAILAPA